jgi:hypothetical protein
VTGVMLLLISVRELHCLVQGGRLQEGHVTTQGRPQTCDEELDLELLG